MDHRIKEKQAPLADGHRAEAQHVRGIFLLYAGKEEAHKHRRLEKRQQNQAENTADGSGAPGPQLGLKLLLPLGNGHKLHIHTADGDLIPRMDGTDIYLLPVDPGAGFGAGIGKGPAAVIVAGQDRVVPGHGGQGYGNVAAFASADDVFPVGHRHLTAVRKLQPGPDFRLSPEGDQGSCAVHQQPGRQGRHNISGNRRKNIGISTPGLGNQVQNRL